LASKGVVFCPSMQWLLPTSGCHNHEHAEN